MITITIKYDGYEYRVPGKEETESSAYYTDDKDDALDTATNYIYKGENVRFKIRRVEELTQGE